MLYRCWPELWIQKFEIYKKSVICKIWCAKNTAMWNDPGPWNILVASYIKQGPVKFSVKNVLVYIISSPCTFPHGTLFHFSPSCPQHSNHSFSGMYTYISQIGYSNIMMHFFAVRGLEQSRKCGWKNVAVASSRAGAGRELFGLAPDFFPTVLQSALSCSSVPPKTALPLRITTRNTPFEKLYICCNVFVFLKNWKF